MQKITFSDKYRAFIMLLSLFTPHIVSELIARYLILGEFKICTEFRMLVVGGGEELPK